MKKYEPDVAGLITKMQQQLFSLERKIDTLIERPRGHGELKQDTGYRERTLYKAVCADCNKECEVPFRPSQDRPVYCKECFSRRKSSGSFKATRENQRPFDKRPFDKRPFEKRPFEKRPFGKKPFGKKNPVHKRRKK